MFNWVIPLHWPSADGQLPPDEPSCGYLDNKCGHNKLIHGTILLATLIPLIIIAIVVVSGIFIFHKLREIRSKYDSNWWRINAQQDLIVKQTRRSSNSATSRSAMVRCCFIFPQ